MKIHDRIVVFISAILLLVTGLILIVMAFGPNPTSFYTNVFLTRQYGGLRPQVIVVSIVAVAAGAYLIWLAFRSRGAEEDNCPRYRAWRGQDFASRH